VWQAQKSGNNRRRLEQGQHVNPVVHDAAAEFGEVSLKLLNR
jgi:hypothetical protein